MTHLDGCPAQKMHPKSTAQLGMCACPALRDAEKRGAERMRAEAVKMADGFVPVCRATGHDERWCTHCDSMEHGIDQYAEAIGKIAL